MIHFYRSERKPPNGRPAVPISGLWANLRPHRPPAAPARPPVRFTEPKLSRAVVSESGTFPLSLFTIPRLWSLIKSVFNSSMEYIVFKNEAPSPVAYCQHVNGGLSLMRIESGAGPLLINYFNLA